MPAFSSEVFTVKAIFPSYPYTYILEDESHEELSGKYYAQELIEAYTGEETTVEQDEPPLEPAAASGESQ